MSNNINRIVDNMQINKVNSLKHLLHTENSEELTAVRTVFLSYETQERHARAG